MTLTLRTLTLATVSIGVSLTPAFGDQPAETGWTVLFDGDSSEHWRGYKSESFPKQGWTIEDGSLKVEAGGGGGDIVTRERYENFELVLDWKVSEKGNSGIMYRVLEEGFAPWNTGPEYQILDDRGHQLEPAHINAAGALYDLKVPTAKTASKPAGEWNHTRITINHGHVEHWLNGVLVLEDDLDGEDFRRRVAASKFNVYEGFGRHPRGHLALQDHGNDVWFRAIRVRDLDAPRHSAVTPVARSGGHHQRFLAMNERVAQGRVDVVFIGDSITQAWEGPGREIWAERYAARNAVNLGISGDRTQHVLWRLEHGNLEGIAPRAAVIMIGTNNSNGSDNSVSEIADGITAIVRLLRRSTPDTKILLLDVFPRGSAPNPQRGKILQVNQIVARLHDGEYVFFHPIGHHFVAPDGTISREIMPDALHLSPAGYRIWADAIEDELAALLGED